MDILSEETAKYNAIWNHPEYRLKCHSMDLWNNNREFFPKKINSALDIGCGLGELFVHWNENKIDAYAIDITSKCLNDDALKNWGHKFKEASLWEMEWEYHFQFGICTDVMEHIPPNKIIETLKRIADCCDEVLFKIAHFVGNDLGGPRLHLTLRPVIWWINHLEHIGGKVEQLSFKSRPGLPDSIIKWKL